MGDTENDDSDSRSWYEWAFDAILELLSLF
jgi:hypothetical protein